MAPFGRLLTAMVTPFNADLSVDYERAAALAQRLVAAGNDGVVVAGTTGESPTLTADEKLKLFKGVKEALKEQGGLVLAGTGTNDTAQTVALSRRAAEVGVDGLLLVTPYYNRPPQAGLNRHFAAVAAAVSVPIMLYNVPSRTAVNLQPDTAAKLAQDFPHIVAVKECVPDQVAELLNVAPGIAVYSGEDANTITMLAQGAVGVVSVAGHVAAPQIKEMLAAWTRGDAPAAAAWHRRLLPVFRGLFITTNPILSKAALTLAGFSCGGVRPPLVDATAAEIAQLQEMLAKLELL